MAQDKELIYPTAE